jgi:hypothetical protein
MRRAILLAGKPLVASVPSWQSENQSRAVQWPDRATNRFALQFTKAE